VPWSEWQTPLDMRFAPRVLDIVRLRTGETTASVTSGPISAFFDFQYLASISHDGDVVSGDLGYHPGSYEGYQFTARPDWATFRNWFPSPLNDLTEGVDYVPRPDRTWADQDVYVEYGSGANQHQGWQMGAITIPALSGGGVTGSLGLELNTAVPSGIDATIGVDDMAPFPSPGPAFVTWTEGAAFTVTPPDPGAALSFSIIPAITVGDVPFGQYAIHVPAPQNIQLVRSPQWRYWIPGPDVPSHVRLLHRGDGLGMNPLRLRMGGTTNQAGRLRGSY